MMDGVVSNMNSLNKLHERQKSILLGVIAEYDIRRAEELSKVLGVPIEKV